MKKILFITSEYPPGPGGIGNQAYNIVRHLRQRGMEIRVVTEKRNYPGTIADHTVTYLHRGGGIFIARFILAAVLHALRFGPHAIFLSGTKSLLAGNFLAGAKKIAVYHGHEWHMSGPVARWLVKRILRRASSVVAVSAFSRGRISTFLDREIIVIPNGIDSELIAAGNTGNSWRPGRPLRLLSVGALSGRKGQINLVRALPLILKTFPQATYYLAGPPLEADKLMEEAKKQRVEEHVKILGVVDSTTLHRLYSRADVFVMLSNNLPSGDVEGFGIAVLEANAFGVPAIGARGTGVEEVIKDGYNGMLVQADNAREVNEAIAKIMNDYSFFSQNSYLVAKRHLWENLIGKYINLIS